MILVQKKIDPPPTPKFFGKLARQKGLSQKKSDLLSGALQHMDAGGNACSIALLFFSVYL